MEMVLESAAMRRLAERVRRLARASIAVLLWGETGTGKEVLARMLHEAGPRADRPFVALDCGALAPELVESTLFGHERGSFTGALELRKGVFEAASGGTLLLDEIGELPPRAQAALLRALETRRVTRVGSTREIEVDVRVVAATHRDLAAMCDDGAFRLDLYHRLNAVVLEVPPLRTRKEEILALAEHFLREEAVEAAGPLPRIRRDAAALLERYAWPGNVRELRNAIRRAIVLVEGDAIGPEDLPHAVRSAPARVGRLRMLSGEASPAPPHEGAGTGGLRAELERREVEVILAALRQAGGSQIEAARRLELPLRTLQHKLQKHGIRRLGHARLEACA